MHGRGAFDISGTAPVVKIVNINNKASPGPLVKLRYTLNDIISADQYNILRSLRYQNGNVIINLDINVGNALLYEFLYRIKTAENPNSFTLIHEFLTIGWKDEDEIFFNLPEFDSAKYKFDKFIGNYHDEREITESAYACTKCKSKETIAIFKQTRSGDEGETGKIICTSCSHSWKIGS
jgi:DNA-directed RNA polymerase subunit M/transcription elongation factor TFIIS